MFKIIFLHDYITFSSLSLNFKLPRYGSVLRVTSAHVFESKYVVLYNHKKSIENQFLPCCVLMPSLTDLHSYYQTSLLKDATISVNRCVWGPDGLILGIDQNFLSYFMLILLDLDNIF